MDARGVCPGGQAGVFGAGRSEGGQQMAHRTQWGDGERVLLGVLLVELGWRAADWKIVVNDARCVVAPGVRD